MSTRRSLTGVAAATAAVWLGAALPASAHPAFRPGNAPTNQTVSAELVIPHSCGAEGMPEDEADQSPTSLVDVQVPVGVDITPHPKDGWTLESTDEGFSYTAQDPTETTVLFPVDVTLSGEEGDRHYVLVYQECVDGDSFSWIGTPDNEAENPAVVLTVGGEAGEHDHGSEPDHSESPTGRESPDTVTDEPSVTPNPSVVVDKGMLDGFDDDNLLAWTVIGTGVALAAGVSAYLWRRRSLGGPQA